MSDEGKKWRTIMGIEVQDPKDKITFSGKDLIWSEIYRTNMSIDRVAKIPAKRVPDFIRGEEMNQEAPCTFVRRQNKPPKSRASASLSYEL